MSSTKLKLPGSPKLTDVSRTNIVCYNIHWCVGTDMQYNPDRTADAIRRAANGAVDIVCLQEVHQYTTAFPTCCQATRVAGLLNMDHIKFGATMQGSPCQRDGVGAYGNAIISRFPLEVVGRFAFQHKNLKEPRGALAVRVDMEQSSIIIIVVHMDTQLDCKTQLELVQQFVEWPCTRQAHVVCGDFNYVPYSRAIELMQSRWLDAWLIYGRSQDNARMNLMTANKSLWGRDSSSTCLSNEEEQVQYVEGNGSFVTLQRRKRCCECKMSLFCCWCLLPCIKNCWGRKKDMYNYSKLTSDTWIGRPGDGSAVVFPCTYLDGCTRGTLRVDYFFVTETLEVEKMTVCKNLVTRTASDHYPLCLTVGQPLQ